MRLSNTKSDGLSLEGASLLRGRRRLLSLALVLAAATLLRVRHGASFLGLPRSIAAAARLAGRTTRHVQDPVNNVSPEMQAAGNLYAQRYEDVVMAGHDIWKKMKALDGEANVKKVYFIGGPGSQGGEIAESVLDSLGYIPAPDGTQYIRRKPGMGYPPIKYTMWHTDAMIGNKSKIAPTDLFIEDEEQYRDLESEVLQDFDALPANGYPMGCIVGEGAVMREKNREILKKGIIIWCDVDPGYSWVKVMSKPQYSSGIFIPPQSLERPPVWAIANGWDGDVDDTEAKEMYINILSERRKVYEELSNIRLRTDIPGVAENSYWGAERILKSMNEYFGFKAGESTVEQEVMAKDLEKFLEGARLSKYYKPALEWCEEQGAASIEDVVENIPDFEEALGLKPLEKKRLSKAAASVLA